MKRAAAPLQQLSSSLKREPHVRLLTEWEAADHCRYFDRGCADPVGAFQKWARRAGVPVKYAGRARLYDPRTLDAFIDRESWTLRHSNLKPRVARSLNLVHDADSLAVAQADGKSRKGDR